MVAITQGKYMFVLLLDFTLGGFEPSLHLTSSSRLSFFPWAFNYFVTMNYILLIDRFRASYLETDTRRRHVLRHHIAFALQIAHLGSLDSRFHAL
jgi:hypothetical protein